MRELAAPPDRVPRYYLGPFDRITIDDLEYGVVESNQSGHILYRTDKRKLNEAITHRAFLALLKAPRFSHDRDWFAPEKARVRLRAGVAGLRDLPDHEQAEILWKQEWCQAFLRLQAADKTISKSDPKMKLAIARIAPGIRDPESRGRKPDPKTLRAWMNLLLSAGGDPLIMRDQYRNCGNRTPRIPPASYALMVQHAWLYAKPTRPDKASIYKGMLAAFEEENQTLRARGLPDLSVPSRERLYQEIDSLPAFRVCAARHGPEYARAKFLPVLEGNGAVRPLQRVEMDMWKVQLHVLCIDAGIWETLTPEEKKVIERTRKVLCVAIDCATRCILGMRFSDDNEGEKAQTAINTLEMALSDKAPYVGASGSVLPWEMTGTPEVLATDNGPAFQALMFKSAAHDVNIGHLMPPAKLPHLRGTIERVFRTAHTQLAAEFEGRSFTDPVDKGDYPAEQRASLTIDELGKALIRYVVDIYHNSEHDGLGGETPRAAWLRLTDRFPVMPPPDLHKKRAAFGTDLSRIVTNRGVRVLGVQYQAPELQDFLQHEGHGTAVGVRLDEADLGHVSVKFGKAWLTVPAPDDGLNGMDADTWLAIIRERRRGNAKLIKLTKPIALAAHRDLRRLSEHASKRANIASQKMTAEQIDMEERKLAIGFEYAHPEAPSKPDGDFYDGAIKVRPPHPVGASVEESPPETSPARRRGQSDRPGPWKIEER